MALEKDLETLDAEYNRLSDCMAKGEQNEFNAASLVWIELHSKKQVGTNPHTSKTIKMSFLR